VCVGGGGVKGYLYVFPLSLLTNLHATKNNLSDMFTYIYV